MRKQRRHVSGINQSLSISQQGNIHRAIKENWGIEQDSMNLYNSLYNKISVKSKSSVLHDGI